MLVVLLLFSLFIVLEMPSDLVLQAIEKVQAQMYAQIFAVYNVVSAIILMKLYGVTGVAYATGSALMLKCLFLCYMVYKYTNIKPKLWPITKVMMNTVITGVVVYFVGTRGTNISTFSFAVGSGLATYGVLFFINNPLGDYEKNKLNQYMGRKLF
jgi:O-antigen/teichoic acid export membrane protein